MSLGPIISSFLIVWNVGQGQWVTSVEQNRCRHFDMGGEVLPWNRIKELCHDKINELYISHWDQDHINALPFFKESGFKMCKGPESDFPAPKWVNWYSNLPLCISAEIQILRPHWNEKDFQHRRNRNESSLIYNYHKFLFSGDSPIKMEKWWAPQLNSDISTYVLGHHGSKTATSEALLKKLVHLKLAISSARQEVYGHPHPAVVERLNKFHIPLLRTEDWGNIIFPLSMKGAESSLPAK